MNHSNAATAARLLQENMRLKADHSRLLHDHEILKARLARVTNCSLRLLAAIDLEEDVEQTADLVRAELLETERSKWIF